MLWRAEKAPKVWFLRGCDFQNGLSKVRFCAMWGYEQQGIDFFYPQHLRKLWVSDILDKSPGIEDSKTK